MSEKRSWYIDTSIVIPVYKEEKYLRTVILQLLKQTCIYRCEIVLSEFNPDNSLFTRRLMKDLEQMTFVPIRLIQVFERGIPLARHEGIMAASGQMICDFDADAVWSTPDDLQKMLDPIIEGKAVMTNCDSFIDLKDATKKQLSDPFVLAANPVMGMFNTLQRITNWSIGDPGTCFLKSVYEESGGFDLDGQGWETGAHLTPKIAWKYPGKIKNVPGVKIIQSPRRALKGPKVLGRYDKAIRKGEVLELEPKKYYMKGNEIIEDKPEENYE